MNTPTVTTTTSTTPRRPRARRNKKRQIATVETVRQQSVAVQPRPKQRGPLYYQDLLSGCAKDYLSVLENPWSGKVACVPTIPSVPSRKVRYWNKGVLSTGTDGFGYILFNPFNPSNDPSGDTEWAVFFSDSNYAQTFATTNSATPGVVAAALNSEYTNTLLNSNAVKYRLVSAGLRVRYAGTELNRGGRVFMLEEPDHGNLDGDNIGDIAKYDSHKVFRPDQQWKSVVFHPSDEDEFDYISYPNRPGNFFLCAMLDSPGGGSLPIAFEYEAMAIYELLGAAVRGLTPTPADLVGLSAAQSFTNRPEARLPRTGDRSPWVTAAINAAGRILYDSASGFARSYFQTPRNSPRLTTSSSEVLIEEV